MPRELRLRYPDAMCHVMSRGDRREPIFHDDTDRRLFLQTSEEVGQKTDWQIHAWRLISNHFHLVVETPRANSERMERRRTEGLSKEFKPVERGWHLGGEQFRRELLEEVSRGAGARAAGPGRRRRSESCRGS